MRDTQSGQSGGRVLAADGVETVGQHRWVRQIGDGQRETAIQVAFQGFAEADAATAMPAVSPLPLDDLVDHHVVGGGHRADWIAINHWRNALGRQQVQFLQEQDGIGDEKAR
ncbi:MAG: hypothetical protein R3F40_14020 [Candidatus Competibacteraceae bacterium]